MTPQEQLDAYAARRYEVEHGGPDCYHLASRELSKIAPATFAALRDVLKLHSPIADRGAGQMCAGCATHVTFTDYPCATVLAITAALEAS